MLLTLPFLLGARGPAAASCGVLVLAFVAGIGVETFGVLWDTAMQQEIPADRLSRVYSYDALGSWRSIPLGLALAGPVAEAIGTARDADGRGRVLELDRDRRRAVRARACGHLRRPRPRRPRAEPLLGFVNAAGVWPNYRSAIAAS